MTPFPRQRWQPLGRIALRRYYLGLAVAALLVTGLGMSWRQLATTPSVVGATAMVTEMSTGLELEARVDTGATLCSVHCEEIEIVDEAAEMADNIGRRLRCLLKNNRGETRWLETRIVDVRGVRTTSRLDDRYVVDMRIRVAEHEDTVRVTLNDRSAMTYPFLLGRNFLRDNLIVDVSQDRRPDEYGPIRPASSSAVGQ